MKLQFIEFGEGNLPLLAFHGFGQNPYEMKALEGTIGKHYRIYSFSLFFHGKSEFPTKKLGTDFPQKRHIKKLFEEFLDKNGIERFNLAGYSIGGKLSLTLFELFHERIDSVYLFAPDGLITNPWVKFVTKNTIGKRLYKWYIDNPGIISTLISLSSKLRITDQKQVDFVKLNTSSREQRLQVFKVWQAFMHLDPDIKLISTLLKEKRYNFHLFFGKYDKIIKTETGRKFINSINKRARLHIIFTGHRLLGEKTRKYLSLHPEIYNK